MFKKLHYIILMGIFCIGLYIHNHPTSHTRAASQISPQRTWSTWRKALYPGNTESPKSSDRGGFADLPKTNGIGVVTYEKKGVYNLKVFHIPFHSCFLKMKPCEHF